MPEIKLRSHKLTPELCNRLAPHLKEALVRVNRICDTNDPDSGDSVYDRLVATTRLEDVLEILSEIALLP